MSWFSSLTNWIPGGGIVKAVSGAVQSWQERRKASQQAKAEARAQKQALRGKWELMQAKRASTFARWTSYTIFWGPILHAYYLACRRLPADASPEDVGKAVEAAIGAFPAWWTGAAVTITLAIWGIRETQHGSITQAAMRVQEKEAEADAERERNKRSESHGPGAHMNDRGHS